jgi:hypothetical protein
MIAVATTSDIKTPPTRSGWGLCMAASISLPSWPHRANP